MFNSEHQDQDSCFDLQFSCCELPSIPAFSFSAVNSAHAKPFAKKMAYSNSFAMVNVSAKSAKPTTNRVRQFVALLLGKLPVYLVRNNYNYYGDRHWHKYSMDVTKEFSCWHL